MAPFFFGPMMLDDVPAIGVLERICFTSPWSDETYRHELKHNPRAFYYVLRATPAPGRPSNLPPILAYAGYWILGDEAHIVTIATHPALRRKHIGDLVLLNLISRARETGIEGVTLEVRRSNEAAQRLYAKWGFVEVGMRKRYYRDNNEDALLLTLFAVHTDRVWLPLSAALTTLEGSLSLDGAHTDAESSSPSTTFSGDS